MTDSILELPVNSDEHLARFILTRRHLRHDFTVKPDAFIPHPWPDLSVTRHLHLSETKLWDIGRTVAATGGKRLHARSDIQAAIAVQHKLRVVAAPTENNPNHAIIIDWPSDKPTQKVIAQELAASAGKAHQPPNP